MDPERRRLIAFTPAPGAPMPKFRYEFPPRTAHFVQAPSSQAVVRYIRRTFPHNYDEVLATLVQIPRWPEFWKDLDEHGRPRPRDME